MKVSGYNENYRFQVLKSGMEGHDKMLEVERGGGRPVNRPRTWNEDERQKKKELQSKSWFRAGGSFDVPFVCSSYSAGGTSKENKSKGG